jgi:uncharacterized protein
MMGVSQDKAITLIRISHAMEWIAQVPWSLVAYVAVVFCVAYTVFGATGFGAGIIAVPLLAHVLPLSFIVPLVCVMDAGASAWTGLRNYREVDRRELGWMLPFMFVGMALGMFFLLKAPSNWLLGALGVFVMCYGGYNLFIKLGGLAWSAKARAPFGVVGGVFSATFGTGGPIYAVFYSGRIADKGVLRATIASTISVSVLLRLGGFVVTGLLWQPRLLMLVALTAPAVMLGLFLGGRLHERLPRNRILQLISVMLLVNGMSLLVRAFG